MLRPTVIAALFGALAFASPAAADDCMCFGGFPSLTGQRLESFEVGPFFSSDGTLLVSAIRIEKSGEKLPSGEVLFCWSPMDPRCAPSSPSPERTPRALSGGHGGVALVGSYDWPPLESSAVPELSRAGLGPQSGIRSRVERPPRT